MNLTTLTRSSTLRYMLIYVALFVTSVLLVLAFIYWLTVDAMRVQIDDTIDTEIAGLAERFEASGLLGMNNLIAQRVKRQAPTADSIYLFTDANFRRISGNLSAWPPKAREFDQGWIEFSLRRDGTEERTARARVFTLDNGLRLLVGRDIHTFLTLKRRLQSALGWATALILALGIAGAFAMTRPMMRRIEAINLTSESIVRSGDLSRRIPERGTSDDLDELSRNLNSMLARIEELMTGVRQVSDSIAHDLRTPLARLRNRLETARNGDSDRTSRKETIEQALDETDGLLATFNALLRISRLETGDLRREFTTTNVHALCEDVVELYQPVAEDRHVTLSLNNALDPVALAQLDRDLVFQAVANLVDNAVKFSPSDTEIHITVAHHLQTQDDAGKGIPATVSIAVCDQGPGIDPSLHERVFDRFFRADASRHGSGNGLGLALVKAVCRAHDAQIRLSDAKPGLCVTLSFAATEGTGVS